MTTVAINKLIIGLTGNIATGKSAVLRLAAERGALVIDADKLVHELLNHNSDIQAAIALAFGPEVRLPDGRIDRQALGNIVFQDADAMRDLEMMIHPAVRRAIYATISQSEAPIVIIEAIKLLEGDLATICDQIWVTRCSTKRQMQRLLICRGIDQQAAQKRIEAQPPQEEKVARADVVIDTDGLMQATETQFNLAWERLPDLAEVEMKEFALPDDPAPFTQQPAPQPQAPSRPQPQRPAQPKAAPARSTAGAPTLKEAAPLPPVERPDDLDIRRARPSDIPAILLLMQQATGGKVKMKRADLLMALGERSYFLGQRNGEVRAVLGWNIESRVASVDQVFIHPPEETAVVGAAILEEIEESADQHIAELVVIFVPLETTTPELKQLLAARGYTAVAKLSDLPKAWQTGIKEHQPEDTEFFIRILRERQ